MTHRARLTLVSTVTAGAILALVLLAIEVGSRNAEISAQEDVLSFALRQAVTEVDSSPGHPDLLEIAAPNPGLALAAYDDKGRLINKVGSLPISADVPNGLNRAMGVEAISRSVRSRSGLIVAALPWAQQKRSLRWLAFILASVWAPITACAAAVTWVAAKSTFAPLERMTREAALMSGRSLSERLATDGTDEYSALAVQLNGLLSRVEESMVRQERFVADAAHELRTPLTILRGTIETALQRRRSADEYEGTLAKLLSEAERLSSLVEMLLRSAGPVDVSAASANLAEVAESAHARWVDRFEKAGVALQLDTVDLEALADNEEAGVILDNLLSNALRASPANTTCRIAVRKAGEMASLSVEDEGPGLAPDLVERVFDRFVRGDTGRNRSSGGFGIGLSVCRRLVEGRHGTVAFEPGRVSGAKVVVKFPAPQTGL